MPAKEVFERDLEKLIAIARIARDAAVNYRNFFVGAAVVARRRGRKTVAYFAGANQMLHKGDPHKCCAEKAAITEAIRCGYTRIYAVVVVGKLQPDDESGYAGKTLHPCGTCRRMFRELGLQDDTIVLTVDHKNPAVREQHTVAELIARHDPSACAPN